MPARARLLLAGLALLAACRHVPPDKEAREVKPALPAPRTPTAEELQGIWISRSVRGALADLGSFAVYVFGPDGRYTGALSTQTESTPVEGRYTYASGLLNFDGGALEMKATLRGERLQLVAKAAYLELIRPPPYTAR